MRDVRSELLSALKLSPGLHRLGFWRLERLERALLAAGVTAPRIVEPGQDLSDLALAPDEITLLGGQSLIQVDWSHAWDRPGPLPQGSLSATARFTQGMTLAFQEDPNDRHAIQQLKVYALRRSECWCLPVSVLSQVLGSHGLTALYRYHRAEVACALSPLISQLELHQRALVIDRMEEIHLEDGQLLHDFDQRFEHICLVGRQGALLVEHHVGEVPADAPMLQRQYGPGLLPYFRDPLSWLAECGSVIGLGAMTLHNHIRERAVAVGHVHVFRIRPAEVWAIGKRVDAMPVTETFGGAMLLHAQLPQVVATMLADPFLSERATPGQLAMVTTTATVSEWRVGVPPPQPIGTSGGLCIVLRGELVSYATGFMGGDHLGSLYGSFASHPPGSKVGFPGLDPTDDQGNLVQARQPSMIAFISKERLKDVLGHTGNGDDAGNIDTYLLPAGVDSKVLGPYRSPTFYQAPLKRFVPRAWPDVNHDSALYQASPRTRMVAVDIPGDRPDRECWRRILAAGLLSTWRDFREASLLLVVDTRGGATDAPPEVLMEGEGYRVLRVTAAPDLGAILQLAGQVVASNKTPERAWLYIELLGPEALRRELVEEALYQLVLNDDLSFPLPTIFSGRTPFLFATRLPPLRSGRIAPSQPMPPGTVRLRLDHPQGSPEALLAASPGTIQRFARALSYRRIGVALGGGGAWGMAHLAVLEALHNGGIPIDLVSGSSVGSVVGALYCAKGIPGLDQFVAERVLFQAATLGGIVTSTIFVAAVRRIVEDLTLAEIETPFFPVATDLIFGSEDPILRGYLATAARKSGSLAPFYPSTPTAWSDSVDGGISRNVPVRVLHVEGARTAFASNIVPPPSARRPRPPTFSGTAGRVLADLNPMRRARAAFRSVFTLFYTAGAAQPDQASVTFETRWSGSSPMDLLVGPQFIRDTQSTPEFWANVAAAQERWKTLCLPAFEVDG